MGKSRRSSSRASTSSPAAKRCKIYCAGFSEKRPSRVLPTITEMAVIAVGPVVAGLPKRELRVASVSNCDLTK
jgi:hypothetical protein